MPAQENVNDELAKLRLEKERLELEQLREQVAKMKDERARKVQSHEQIERDLTDFANRQKQAQEYCNHRKGGRGIEGLQGRGSDANYAIVHHRLPFGDIAVMCLRCQKIWRQGDPGYKDALQFPTDNEMSEAAQFRTN